MIVAIGGRSRTGKSELARHLTIVTGGVLLGLAQLRTVLFPTSRTTSHEQAACFYEWLLQAAVRNLHQRLTSPVVLDAHPLTRARDERVLRHLVGGIGHRLHVIECVRTAPVSKDPAQKATRTLKGHRDTPEARVRFCDGTPTMVTDGSTSPEGHSQVSAARSSLATTQLRRAIDGAIDLVCRDGPARSLRRRTPGRPFH